MLEQPQCQAILRISRANKTVSDVTVLMLTSNSQVNFLAHGRVRVINCLADASGFEKMKIKDETRFKTL